MVFRVSLTMVALLMTDLVGSFAAAQADSTAPFAICHILSDGEVPTFETLYITDDEYEAYEAEGDLYGPCREWIGDLCDDGVKCTSDYDYEAAVCLPMPRVMLADCTGEVN